MDFYVINNSSGQFEAQASPTCVIIGCVSQMLEPP